VEGYSAVKPGKILVEEDEIMKEIESFYENLYASHDEDNNGAGRYKTRTGSTRIA